MEPSGRQPTYVEIDGAGHTFWAALSVPRVRLTADKDGILVAIPERTRRTLVRYAPRLGVAKTADAVPIWSAPWAEMESAIAATRSIVIWRRDGMYCRFVTFRRRHLRPLLAMLASHDVQVTPVRSTILLGSFRRDASS